MTTHEIPPIEPKAPGQHIFSCIPIPRLGNVLLATIPSRHGYDCRVLVEEVRSVRTEDLAWADIVGISSTTTTAPAAYAWPDTARAAGKVVVMGGPHVTFLADEALEHSDYVVRGEGDDAILELAQALDGARDPALIPGLSYRAMRPRGSSRRGKWRSRHRAPEQRQISDRIPDFGYRTTGGSTNG